MAPKKNIKLKKAASATGRITRFTLATLQRVHALKATGMNWAAIAIQLNNKHPPGSIRDRYTCWKKGGRTRAGTWVPDTIPFQLEDKEDKEDKEGSQDNKD